MLISHYYPAQEKQDVEENPVTPDGSGNHDDPDQKEPIAEVEAETEVEPIVEVEAEYSGKCTFLFLSSRLDFLSGLRF